MTALSGFESAQLAQLPRKMSSQLLIRARRAALLQSRIVTSVEVPEGIPA